ncbi:hypothetical protein E6O75_ATG05398 [Venturia nashicola]|uniref:Uncharacterized protein n=1 Tax=Venturia nashicola TaxID=86259 RepID=A0A4Z1PGA8_9PEZI|nr:hypothetical protein E6O75_ATG05398 [Venturia nashicola]
MNPHKALQASITGLPWSTGTVHTQYCTGCSKKSEVMYRKCADCSHAICKDCFNSDGMRHPGLCRSGDRWYPTLAQEQEILAAHGARAPLRPANLPEPPGHREDWRDWTSSSTATSMVSASSTAAATPSTPSRNAAAGGPSSTAGNSGSSLIGSSPTVGIPILNKPKDWRSPVKKERKRKAKSEAESSPAPASGRRKISETQSAPVAKPAPVAQPASVITKPAAGPMPFGLKVPAVKQPVRKVVIAKTSSTSGASSTSNASSTAKKLSSTETVKASASNETSTTSKTSASTDAKVSASTTSTKASSSTKAISFATAKAPASLNAIPSAGMIAPVKTTNVSTARQKEDEAALWGAPHESNELEKKKPLPSAFRVPGKSARDSLTRRVSFVEKRITTNFDTDDEDEDDATWGKRDQNSQAIAPKTNARGPRRIQPPSSFDFGYSAETIPTVFPESNERATPITRMTSERNRGSSVPPKMPSRKRREYSPYSEDMVTGTSDVNRLGPSSHARTENVVQNFPNATAASGVVTLDVRGIDTLTLKTAPGFYIRTDASGKEAELPAQMFYQWLGEGRATLHQEFVLYVDDAKNPPHDLIGTRDIPTNGAFEGFEMNNGKMGDLQSAITSAKPRVRSARIAKLAEK